MKFFATIDRDCAATTPPGIPVMMPISAWWWRDINLRRSVTLPHPDIEVAVDVGSFNFASRFEGFPFGIDADSIVSWCKRLQPPPRWVVLPDWPCEGLDKAQVARAQQRTLDTHLHVLERHADAPWTWVPVIQGLRLNEYAAMTVGMADLIYALRDFYAETGRADDFRVGIGSICRRGQTATIMQIVCLIAAMLPGIRLHLFGVKLDVLRNEPLPPEVLSDGSFDTAAWNRRFGTDIPAFNRGMAATRLTQREYAWRYAYPDYARAVQRALARRTPCSS